MYSTMPGCNAYAPTDEGPLMTNKLAHLFRHERDSIANLETKLSTELKGYNQVCPLAMLQLNQPISLLEEQEDKMRPTNVQLRMETSTTLLWDLPALGGYFGLTNFTAVWKESANSDGWTPISIADCHQTYVSIDTTQFSTSSRYIYVAVQANYHDGRCITTEEFRLDIHKDYDGELEGADNGGIPPGIPPGCRHFKVHFGLVVGLIFLLLLLVGVNAFIGTFIRMKSSLSKRVHGFNGDTVECDRLSSVLISGINVSECGGYKGFDVNVYVAEGQLKTYMWTHEAYDPVQPVAARFGIPMNAVRVPYLFEGSTIAALICLTSTMNVTATPVQLYIFDGVDKRNSFLQRRTDGEAAVYQQQLPVGSRGQMNCSYVSYEVQYGGYYCFGLDSPSKVTFTANLTEDIIGVNTSEYQVGCTIAESDSCIANIPFSSSSSVRILCHILKYQTRYLPKDTYLCSTRRPQWNLLYILCSILVLPVVVCIIVIVHCCWKQKQNRNEYQAL